MVRLGDTGMHALRPTVLDVDGSVLFHVDGEYWKGREASGKWSIDYPVGRRRPGGAKSIKDVPPKAKRKA